jgi:CheY-like chemotaxis protein
VSAGELSPVGDASHGGGGGGGGGGSSTVNVPLARAAVVNGTGVHGTAVNGSSGRGTVVNGSPIASPGTSATRSPVAGTPSPASAAVATALRGLRVLFADDEAVNQRVGRRFLSNLSCTATVVGDGDEVLTAVAAATALWDAAMPASFETVEIVAPEPGGSAGGLGSPSSGSQLPCAFDAVLLDINMRRLNGDAACRQLRQRGHSVPLIAMTGELSCPSACLC